MKVAVVGSGVSGLAATWLLNEHSDHEVHLFEADDRPGGHANTVSCQMGGTDLDVDTGFIVFNPTTYPNFLRFLSFYPDITILPTDMTFSVSRDHGAFEWGGGSLSALFCQPWRVLDPCLWRLLYDILRFNACAKELLLDEHRLDDCSVAEYLVREGYSDTFRDDYLIPMTAAIWSTPPDKCLLEFPAQTLVRFMNNHHLLQIFNKPSWLTIKGGSRQYVNAILNKLPKDQLHLSTPIASVGNDPDGTVRLTTADGRAFCFDRVIMACHSDTTLALLRAGTGLTAAEETILGRFTWSRNEAVLHNDVNLMPKNEAAWSAWNYLTFSAVGRDGTYKANVDKVSLMNILQHVPASKHGPVLVTLNPPVEPASNSVIGRFKYDHPVVNAEARASVRDMPTIQNARGILYAGAWLGYGFHEDGFTSSLRAIAWYMPEGVRLPFDIASGERPVSSPSSSYPFGMTPATVFGWVERSGARHVLGGVFAFVLALIGSLVLAGGNSRSR